MERLDVGCVLMAIHVDSKLDRIMKVRIGEGLFNDRLLEDEMFMPYNIHRTRRPSTWREEGIDSMGSEDGEWWPENNSDDRGFKKQDRGICDGGHSPAQYEGGSAGVEEEEQLFTKMDKSSTVEVMDVWIENQNKREVEEVVRLGEAGEERERLRKRKGIVKGLEEDDGFTLQIGPNYSLPSPNQFNLEDKLKRHVPAHVGTNHVLSKEMQKYVKKVPQLGLQEVAQLPFLEISCEKMGSKQIHNSSNVDLESNILP
ncbi:hypothetical protein TanjilG_21645 [Lupinus angustifolius]|uniref:Uncharacterized protein n=1 Tax=Lupinus angustifolius TaxID=3871 RepID=A0A4P1QUS8_LUPAN|nr:hypothetical protein TanjilG_21645 [Lupinus angustifolius]